MFKKTSKPFLIAMSITLLSFGLSLAQDTVTFELWHFASQRDPVIDEWIEEYKTVAPDVTINKRLIPHSAFWQNLTAAFVAGEAPALYFGLPFGEPQERFQNGQIVDLTPHLDEAWRQALYESTLEFLTIDGKVLSMSDATNNSQVIYNQAFFEKIGIETPIETMEALSEAVTALAENGHGGIIYQAFDASHAVSLFVNWAQQLYPDLFQAADLSDGPWDVPEFVEVLQSTHDYNDIWVPGLVSLENAEALNLLARGEVSMYITGNWSLKALSELESPYTFGAFPVPALNDETRPAALASLAGTWMVTTQVPEREQQAAIEFLRWFTINQQASTVSAVGLCPAGPPGEAGLEEVQFELATALCDDQSTGVRRDLFDIVARDTMAEQIQGMLLERVQPSQVLRVTQRATERSQ